MKVMQYHVHMYLKVTITVFAGTNFSIFSELKKSLNLDAANISIHDS